MYLSRNSDSTVGKRIGLWRKGMRFGDTIYSAWPLDPRKYVATGEVYGEYPNTVILWCYKNSFFIVDFS